MDKKLSVWQGLLIASIITPICKHLTYPWNLTVMILVVVVLVVVIVKDRKKYNKFNFAGMFSGIIGSILVVMMMMGKLNDFSLRVQMVVGLGPIFLGLFLIGLGNHIKDPKRVPIKNLIIILIMAISLILCFWNLFSS